MSLAVVPISQKAALAWVRQHHRKLKRVKEGLFAIAVAQNGRLCGVAIVGRPARLVQDGWTCEVVRVATDGTRNACSFLYARSRRAAQLLGYRRVLTKTLPEEGGASLRASGAIYDGLTSGGEWDRPSRRRAPAECAAPKARWVLYDADDPQEPLAL